MVGERYVSGNEEKRYDVGLLLWLRRLCSLERLEPTGGPEEEGRKSRRLASCSGEDRPCEGGRFDG